MDTDRDWWLRVPAVLLSPRSVFVALREESREAMDARSEPILALVCLAGIAVALGTTTAGTLYDDPEYDALLVAVWAVIAGGFTAFAGYFLVGGALYLGTRGLGSLGSFRRERQVLGFAVAPLALSLAVFWPVRIAGFAVWSVVLLLVGVRAVHGWSWLRSLAALGLVALFLAALAYLPSLV
jgi:hypothetical protein